MLPKTAHALSTDKPSHSMARPIIYGQGFAVSFDDDSASAKEVAALPGGAVVFFVAAEGVAVEGALGADLMGFAAGDFRFDEGCAVFGFNRTYPGDGFLSGFVSACGAGPFIFFVAEKRVLPDFLLCDSAAGKREVVFFDTAVLGRVSERTGPFEALTKYNEAAGIPVEAVERARAKREGSGDLVREVGGYARRKAPVFRAVRFTFIPAVGKYTHRLIDYE